MTSPIQRALLSVSDKTGLVAFAQGLATLGIELLSTGGTARTLIDAGLRVTQVADFTGFAEMLDGRVKTLHPKIHAGILYRRDLPDHVAALEKAHFAPIDLVVVNLYPFKQTINTPSATFHDAIENIDIGGPAMVRSAAKNHAHVSVLTNPADYAPVLSEILAQGGVSDKTRLRLAAQAFQHTAAYDAAIGEYLHEHAHPQSPQPFPEQLHFQFQQIQSLRYGENPHQQAAFYRDLSPAPGSLANYQQIQGKALSYNNIADADAAWECVKSFALPACVIVKHANPCGVGIAHSLQEAYQKALLTDPTSAFGGIVAFNRELDEDTAQALSKLFVEVILAPRISTQAATVLAGKTNVRVLQVPVGTGSNPYDLKRVGGGLLVQSPDNAIMDEKGLKIVTRVKPTPSQLSDLLFAWSVAKFVKSNAIVFCANGQTLGVGAGQMSRVDSARIASIKAKNANLTLEGSVVASDAFFPFRDGLDVVVAAGARAVIQPGGSIRDDEVIAAADEQGIAMVYTGFRHFRH